MKQKTKGRWITKPDRTIDLTETTYLSRFRKTLELAEVPEHLMLTVSADSRYKLSCNGKFVQFGPCKGDDQVRFSDTIDLAPFLKAGRNALAAELLCVSRDPWNSNHSLFTSGLHGLYVAGVEANGWRCHVVRHTAFSAEEEGFSPLHIHEIAQGEPACARWREPDFDDSGWELAAVCAPDEVPPVLRGENLRQRAVEVLPGNIGRVDLPHLHTAPRILLPEVDTVHLTVGQTAVLGDIDRLLSRAEQPPLRISPHIAFDVYGGTELQDRIQPVGILKVLPVKISISFDLRHKRADLQLGKPVGESA